MTEEQLQILGEWMTRMEEMTERLMRAAESIEWHTSQTAAVLSDLYEDHKKHAELLDGIQSVLIGMDT